MKIGIGVPLLFCTLLLACSPHKDFTSRVINVEDYGANGQDTKDDTRVLLAIFNALRPNQEVIFPKGTFILSEPLNIRAAGVTVSGEGDESIIQFSNKNDLYARYKSRVGMLNVIADRVTIKDIKLDQNFRGSGRKDGDFPLVGGILIGGTYLGSPKTTNMTTINEVVVYDYYGDAISGFNAVTNDIEITKNRVVSSYIVGKWTVASDRGGQQAISVTGGRNIKMNDNIIEGSLDDAIATHAYAYDVEIQRNTITTTAGRILVCGAHGALVDHNTILLVESANGGGAIWVTFENQRTPHQPVDVSENVRISNNIIKVEQGVDNNFGYLIRLLGAGDNIRIENNIIEANGTNNGIQITDLYHKISGWVQGNNYVIAQNEIRNCKWSIVVDPRKSKQKVDIIIKDNKTENNIYDSPKIFY